MGLNDPDPTVRCTNCGRVLSDANGAPCPDCGGTARTYEKGLTGVLTVSGTLSKVSRRTRSYIERHWPWFAVSVVIALVSVVIGLVLGGVIGLVVAVILAAIGYPAASRAQTTIRETVERRE